jgi:hypothetical protein
VQSSAARSAGRQFELVREVTAYEPNRRQAVKTISGPLRVGGTRTFQAIPGGTRITFGGGGRAGDFFGLADRCCSAPPNRPCGATWGTLKRLLENPTTEP